VKANDTQRTVSIIKLVTVHTEKLLNSIQFIFRSCDPEGGCNPQDIEHVNYI